MLGCFSTSLSTRRALQQCLFVFNLTFLYSHGGVTTALARRVSTAHLFSPEMAGGERDYAASSPEAESLSMTAATILAI